MTAQTHSATCLPLISFAMMPRAHARREEGEREGKDDLARMGYQKAAAQESLHSEATILQP